MTSGKEITWVVVADGGKAMTLELAGPDRAPKLKELWTRRNDNPPTREQGTDKPGRMHDTGVGHRSATETADWHELEETRFLSGVGEELDRAAQAGTVTRIVLIAPPKALGRLRGAIKGAAGRIIAAEVSKDLTNHEVEAIEAEVKRTLAPGW